MMDQQESRYQVAVSMFLASSLHLRVSVEEGGQELRGGTENSTRGYSDTVYIHTHTHTHIHMYIHTHTHAHTCTHTQNHTPMHTYAHTLQGILDAYRYTLSQVELYGPTNFSTFLDKAIEYSSGGISQEAQNYHILLIITVRIRCSALVQGCRLLGHVGS